jgi:hypothetical protein
MPTRTSSGRSRTSSDRGGREYHLGLIPMSGRPAGGHDRTAKWVLFGAIIAAFLGLAWLLVGFLTLPASAAWGFDFQAYHAAAGRLLEGSGLYVPESLSGPFQPIAAGLYLYPPPFAISVLPLAAFPLDAATSIWYAAHVLALAAACALLPVRGAIRLASFAAAALAFAVIRDLALGNVSVLLLLPLAVSWRWLDRPIGSMAMAFVIALKPTMAVYLGWWALRRRWAALGWCVAPGLVLILFSLPLVGLTGYADYLTMMRNVSGILGAPNSLDVGSTALGLGVAEPLAALAYVCIAVVAVLAMLLSLRRDPEVGFMVTLSASLLISPLLWEHYLAVLVLPAALLAERGRPWGLALPLLTWLPAESLPLVALLATFLPFLARDREPAGTARPTPAGQLVAPAA